MVSNHVTLALHSAREKLTKPWETKPPEVDNDHLERVHSATPKLSSEFLHSEWEFEMGECQSSSTILAFFWILSLKNDQGNACPPQCILFYKNIPLELCQLMMYQSNFYQMA